MKPNSDGLFNGNLQGPVVTLLGTLDMQPLAAHGMAWDIADATAVASH
jgi:hypothetical protein